MTIIHNLGFPRIGANRELKFALEAYWAGKITKSSLLGTGKKLRKQNWALQAKSGLDFLPVGDFAWYDHILEWTALLGAVPGRFGLKDTSKVGINALFGMVRESALGVSSAAACIKAKWFNTRYSYVRPELYLGQTFNISSSYIFDQITEAHALGYKMKPVIPGPLTWLYLGIGYDFQKNPFDNLKLTLLDNLLPVYAKVLRRLKQQGIEWVQIDEPILALDLSTIWKNSFKQVYEYLNQAGVNVLLATYFDTIGNNFDVLGDLKIQGVHIDLVHAPEQINHILDALDNNKVLSAGVIDGSNIWRTDLDGVIHMLEPVVSQLGSRLWLAPSCSLLHVPVDLNNEYKLDPEIRSWMSFATQKLDELAWLGSKLAGHSNSDVESKLSRQRAALYSRKHSVRIHNPVVQQWLEDSELLPLKRASFSVRIKKQIPRLALPDFPITTVRFFPHTEYIRSIKRKWCNSTITYADYKAVMHKEIEKTISLQEQLGFDVLVHGKFECGDITEYLVQQMAGFAFTENGWVQSCGSDCIKPFVIYGDVARASAMTVGWASYAQSLTTKPVKEILTGPVTLLRQSFVRDDQDQSTTCRQLALALRAEIQDLEEAGIAVIQINEPDLCDGLPLRPEKLEHYFDWAVDSFCLATSGVGDSTQIHAYVCCCAFNKGIQHIAAMDADVTTMAATCLVTEWPTVSEGFQSFNDIGIGICRTHLTNKLTTKNIIDKVKQNTANKRLWVSLDYDLKADEWAATKKTLSQMVSVVRSLRYT